MYKVRSFFGYASVIAAFVLGMSSPALSSESAKNLEVLSDKWLSLEAQKGELKKSWLERKHKISTQLALLSAEKEALQEYLGNLDLQNNDVNLERDKIANAQIKFETRQNLVSQSADALTERLIKISSTLPPPLYEDWREDLSYLRGEDKPNSERLERIARLVLKLHKFNDRIAVHKTAMKLNLSSGMESVQVKQVYLGSSQGWYASEDGFFYGYGRPQNGRWQWWHSQAVEQVLGSKFDPALILKMIKNVEQPAYAELITLPVSISP